MVLLVGTFLVRAMWADFGESYAELAIIILVVVFSSGYVFSIFSGTCLSKVWLTSYDVLAMLNNDYVFSLGAYPLFMRVFPESSLINAFNGMNFTEPGACSCLYLAAVTARPFKVCGVLRIIPFSLINLLLHL